MEGEKDRTRTTTDNEGSAEQVAAAPSRPLHPYQHQYHHHHHHHHSANDDAFSSSSSSSASEGNGEQDHDGEEEEEEEDGDKEVKASSKATALASASAASASAPTANASTTLTGTKPQVSEWDRALESAAGAAVAYRRVTGPSFREATAVVKGERKDDDDDDDDEGEAEEEATATRFAGSPIPTTQTIISDGGQEHDEAAAPSIEVVTSYDDSGQPMAGALSIPPAPQENKSGGAPPPVAPPPPLSTPTLSHSDANVKYGELKEGGGAGLPDVLTTMRLKIESLQLFDSDLLRPSTSSIPAGKGGGAGDRGTTTPVDPDGAATSLTSAPHSHTLPSRPSSSSASITTARRLRPSDRYYQLPGGGPAAHNQGLLLSPRGRGGLEGPAAGIQDDDEEEDEDEGYRESLKRSSQQSISAAVLVSLAHKRYERRRLAAMEMEKICRSLLYQNETERIRAILLLLCDDYVRSTNEDARKGGVVALAACAIALKRAGLVVSSAATPTPAAVAPRDGRQPDPRLVQGAGAGAAAGDPATSSGTGDPVIEECRDLILASVVHACQDHSSRVRYYATESLFNVVKVMPSMAVQHFFILFEILRSLCADVDADVRSGADLLDRKLKEVVVAAVNAGALKAESCLPVFCRFVHARHKPTKRLTLSWLQELSDRLADPAPILEFLHLFLGGVFDMTADPLAEVRDAAALFLQSVLPKLLAVPGQDEPVRGSGGGGGELSGSTAEADTGPGPAVPSDSRSAAKVNYDKILQSLVTTMEHPDPFVRKVAMYWMSRIVKAHCEAPAPAGVAPPSEVREDETGASAAASSSPDDEERDAGGSRPRTKHPRHPQHQPHQQQLPPLHPPPPPPPRPSPASLSVRNALPHILPGILLSIGDDYQADPKKAKSSSAGAAGPTGSGKDSLLQDVMTRALAQQTNETLQAAVRRDGSAYVPYLDGFIVALREELDVAPGSEGGGEGRSVATTAVAGLTTARYPPPVERTPYRLDVKQDGTGIESPGWFSSSQPLGDAAAADNRSPRGLSASTVMSRLCALDWVVVLYESVVPILLKADYAKEFIHAIIHQLVDNPPTSIVHKSLEVLAKITIPSPGEAGQRGIASPSAAAAIVGAKSAAGAVGSGDAASAPSAATWSSPINESNISFAFDVLEPSRRVLMSRNREVFAALIQLYADNMSLMDELSSVVAYMCHLQPPEFVFVSFAVEMDRYVARKVSASLGPGLEAPLPLLSSKAAGRLARDLKFVSSFIQSLNHALMNKPEAKQMRDALRDCVRGASASGGPTVALSERDRQRSRLFPILLRSFAHNLAAALSLCFWAGAYRTANLVLTRVDPLDISLMFLLEVDRFVELLERPLLRHLHVRMLEIDTDPNQEGSGSMLFKALKSVLMMLPQSTCYRILRERMVSVSRFRQSAFPSLSTPTSSSRAAKLPLASYSAIANEDKIVVGLPLSGNDGSDGDDMAVSTKNSADAFAVRVLEARALHCETVWNAIRSESLEVLTCSSPDDPAEAVAARRREWLGYENEEEEAQAHKARKKQASERVATARREDGSDPKYSDLSSLCPPNGSTDQVPAPHSSAAVADDAESRRDREGAALADEGDRSEPCADENCDWKRYWETQL